MQHVTCKSANRNKQVARECITTARQELINRLSRPHERYRLQTTDRQTDRQTDGRYSIT